MTGCAAYGGPRKIVAWPPALLRSWTLRLASSRKPFHELLQVLPAFIERFQQNPLVLAMRADVIDVHREPRMTVRGNACIAQEAAVGRASRHRWNDGGPRPEPGAQRLYGFH